jgi:hypothetical protein
MAIIFMDSFDHYPQSLILHKYDYTINGNTYVGPVDGIGRYGSAGLRWHVSNATSQLNKYFSPTKTLIMGWAAKPVSGTTAGDQFISFLDGGTVHVSVRMSSNNYQVTRAGTTLGTGTFSVVPGSWHYFEIKVTIDNTNGGIHMKINGVDDLRLGVYASTPTALDTQNGASAQVSNWQLGLNTGSNIQWYFDDFYLCDTTAPNDDFLGDTRIEYLVPTGAGNRTMFTPSTGSNWQTVDELSPSDTDYNSASSPGDMDLFGMSNLAGNGLVRGVQTISQAKKDDAGFRKTVPVFYKASGLGDTARFYKGSQDTVSDTFTNRLQRFNTSPDTGVAWTVDEVNAIQYGYAVGDAGMFTIDARLV